MTFQAKSSVVILISLLVVYGGYFGLVASWVGSTPIDDIVYQPLMIATALPLMLLVAVSHAGLAIAAPAGANESDERDRLYSVRSEAIGGSVLAAGVIAGLALAMADTQSFWVAHVLMAALVLSEVVAATVRLVLYRRGD